MSQKILFVQTSSPRKSFLVLGGDGAPFWGGCCLEWRPFEDEYPFRVGHPYRLGVTFGMKPRFEYAAHVERELDSAGEYMGEHGFPGRFRAGVGERPPPPW